MDKKTRRTIRRDLTILTSILLLGLVGVSALTGMGMDEAEGSSPWTTHMPWSALRWPWSQAFTRSCTSVSCGPT